MNSPWSDSSTASPAAFGPFVESSAREGRIVFQPRMGFGEPHRMREGLAAVKSSRHPTVGTITLDAYTRVGDYITPRTVIEGQGDLNGYPILTHAPHITAALIEGIHDMTFPVQVRHGTALPERIFEQLVVLGLPATEGGPISYCLPYSRTPIPEAVSAWKEGCRILSQAGPSAHIESFGGCMLGQLSPPSLLIAITLIEALFFREYGVRSVSLSLAQGTSDTQDVGSLIALRRLAAHYLGADDWHVVFYMYMGVFPNTYGGACNLIVDATKVGVAGGCHRIIVKTPSEAIEIPTVASNLDAIALAATQAQETDETGDLNTPAVQDHAQDCAAEAACIVDAVLALHDDIGTAIIRAFKRGMLDVPYCLHPDNPGVTRTLINADGELRWAKRGKIPRPHGLRQFDPPARDISSDELIEMLWFKANRYRASRAT